MIDTVYKLIEIIKTVLILLAVLVVLGLIGYIIWLVMRNNYSLSAAFNLAFSQAKEKAKEIIENPAKTKEILTQGWIPSSGGTTTTLYGSVEEWN